MAGGYHDRAVSVYLREYAAHEHRRGGRHAAVKHPDSRGEQRVSDRVLKGFPREPGIAADRDAQGADIAAEPCRREARERRPDARDALLGKIDRLSPGDRCRNAPDVAAVL